MPNDESNFDTMRLIEGASASEQYSLEDILEEFAPSSDAVPAPKREPDNPVQPVSEDVPPEPETPEREPEGPVQSLPEEDVPPEPEPPEFHAQSPSELADVIARALANSLDTEPETVQSPAPPEAEPEPSIPPTPEAPPEPAEPLPEPPREPKKPEKRSQAPSAPKAKQEKQTPRPQEKRPEAPSKPREKRAEMPSKPPAAEAAPPLKVQMAEELDAAPVPNGKQKKIPKSRIRPNGSSGLGEALSALRERQKKQLPPNSASLKAAEKHYALRTRICGALSPVRYVILVLMILALAGRRFSWMLLGFLGGTTGTTVAAFCTVLALAVSWRSVVQAISDLRYLHPSYELLLLIVTAAGLADGALHPDGTGLLPLLAIGWCLTGTSELMSSRAKLRSLRSVIAGRTRIGVRIAPDKWEHTDCIGKAPASTSGFVRRLEEPDVWHTGWAVYGPILLIAALIVSAYVSVRTGEGYLTVFVLLLTAALPVSGALCCGWSYDLLSRALGRRGAVSGWYGMKALSGKRTAIIYDKDLFPKGTIVHKGVKVLGGQSPQLLVSYGASLVLRADIGLTEPFTKLLRETGGQIYHVSYFQSAEGGLLGRIDGTAVAVGTYNFMQLMGAMPPKSHARSGVYIALDGKAAGLFAIKYRVRTGAAEDFSRLVGERGLTLLAATKNFCVNPSFLEQWFQVPVGEMLCPKIETRRAMAEPSLLVRGSTAGFVMSEGIRPYSRLVAGARKCCRVGRSFTALSILLSAGSFVYMALRLCAGATVSGAALLLVQAVLFLLIFISARLAVR